jgi:hypothetical protein
MDEKAAALTGEDPEEQLERGIRYLLCLVALISSNRHPTMPGPARKRRMELYCNLSDF